MISATKSLLASVFIISLAIVPISNNAFADQTHQGWASKLKDRANDTIEYAKNNPLYFGALSVGSIAASYLIWKAANQMMNPAIAPAAPLLAAAFAAPANVHRPEANQAPNLNPLNGHRHINPDFAPSSDLAQALEQSAALHAEYNLIGMGPRDLHYQRDIFNGVRLLKTTEEILTALQALMYDHDHVFVNRQNLLAFVMQMPRLKTDQIIQRFQEVSARGWSLLCLVRGLGVLDAEEGTTMLDFRTMQERLLLLLELAQISPLDTVNELIEAQIFNKALHRFDETLLRLAARYFLALRGDFPGQAAMLTIEDEACMKLLLEELLGELFIPVARDPVQEEPMHEARPEAPAAIAPRGEALREVTKEEIQGRLDESLQERRERLAKAHEDRIKNSKN